MRIEKKMPELIGVAWQHHAQGALFFISADAAIFKMLGVLVVLWGHVSMGYYFVVTPRTLAQRLIHCVGEDGNDDHGQHAPEHKLAPFSYRGGC